MISTYLTPVLFPQQDYQYYNNKGYVIHTLCIPHIAQHRTRHVVKVCVPEPAHSAPLCDLRIMKVPVTWHQPKQVTPYVSTTWVSLAPCSQPPPLTTSLLCVFLPTLYVKQNPHVLIQLQRLQDPLTQSFWPMFSEILFHLYKPQIISSWQR